MTQKLCHILFLLLLTSYVSLAQADSIWTPVPPPHYSFVHYDDNTIAGQKQLDSFYYKLQCLKHTHKGRVNVIHIGDSHTQADGVTSVVRNGMQDFFGNAGRGLVFPYQLANSNAPHDIHSSSPGAWKSNRLTSPDKPIATGISGYGIHSASPSATVNIGLKDMEGRQERFNRMVFFLCNDSVCYRMSDNDIASPITFYTSKNSSDQSFTVNTDSMITGFQLARVSSPGGADYSFYGVSLEKRDSAGVLYHTIGVNGARYDQFLLSDLFWSQLAALRGDLFIISLGTNEAQNPVINEVQLAATIDSFVRMIHRIAPHAAVLLTTPAGSYYRKKKPNKSLQNVADVLKRTATSAGTASWDLLQITGGVPGAALWKKAALISTDLVHYNNAGYQLQGALLVNALAKGYNTYDKWHPYKPVKEVKKENKPKTVKTEVIKATIPQTSPKPPVVAKPDTPAITPKMLQPEEEPQMKRKSNIVVEYSD